MKKMVILSIAVVGLAIGCSKKIHKPIQTEEKFDSASAANRYRLHEIIVMYKRVPTQAEVDTQKADLAERGVGPITVRKCHDCQGYVELWEADSIHTMIHAEGISLGTVSKSGTVGDDPLAYYSVNFITSVPMDSTLSCCPNKAYNAKAPAFSGLGKDTIRIAVLDTGIDTTSLSTPGLQWKNAQETTNGIDDDSNCYTDDIHGWNFIGDNSDVTDDNPNFHGTLVSNYVTNEFARSPKNFVQIMSLKTHDASGRGDLFSIICALHYAMDKKANIINASWGFYHYKKGQPHPYLDNLITETMRKKGILFVTAAGNMDKDMDAFARNAYRERYGVEIPYRMLRNIEYHNFYPACLSRKGKNVVTVTTTDGTFVSPRQNYSEQYVDVGVMGDVNDTNAMQFIKPSGIGLISGSSFATAIACGKIGAYFPKQRYSSELDKADVFERLRTATPVVTPPLITFEGVMKKRLIREGKMTYPK